MVAKSYDERIYRLAKIFTVCVIITILLTSAAFAEPGESRTRLNRISSNHNTITEDNSRIVGNNNTIYSNNSRISGNHNRFTPDSGNRVNGNNNREITEISDENIEELEEIIE